MVNDLGESFQPVALTQRTGRRWETWAAPGRQGFGLTKLRASGQKGKAEVEGWPLSADL